MGDRSSLLIRTACGWIAGALLLLWAVGPVFLNAAWTPRRFSSVLLTNGRIEIGYSEWTPVDIMVTPVRNRRERLTVGYDNVWDSTRPLLDAGGQPSRAGVVWFPAVGSWSLWPSSSSGVGATTYRVPYWCLAVPFTFVAFALDRRRRLHERRGTCRRCGYSRQGLPAGQACPECGTP